MSVLVLLACCHAVEAEYTPAQEVGYADAAMISSNDEESARKIAELLESFADRVHGNYERIRSWRANYTFTDGSLADGWLLNKVYAEVDAVPPPGVRVRKRLTGYGSFAVDLDADKLLTSFRVDGPSTLTVVGTGRVLDASHIKTRQADVLVLPEETIHLVPDRPVAHIRGFPDAHAGGLTPGRVAFKDPRSYVDGGAWGDVIDPRNYFAVSSMRTVWEDFRVHAEGMRRGTHSPGKTEIRERTGAAGTTHWVTVYLGGRRGIPRMRKVYRLDPAVDLMPVVWQQHAELPGQGWVLQKEMTWDWVARGEIRIPSRITSTDVDERTGEVTFRRVLNFDDQTINESIDPDVFTVSGGLGLEEGENLVDRVEEKLLVMDGGEAVAVPVDGPASWFWWWVAGGAVTLLAAGGFVRRRLAAP